MRCCSDKDYFFRLCTRFYRQTLLLKLLALLKGTVGSGAHFLALLSNLDTSSNKQNIRCELHMHHDRCAGSQERRESV
jgi:hypothetical protein